MEMTNSFGVPGITVQELAGKIDNEKDFILLDIREDIERLQVNLDQVTSQVKYLPLSRFNPAAVPEFLADALNSPAKELVIMCHHGIRSAQLTYWLLAQGYNNVVNLDCGIDAYAIEIDPQIGRY